MLYLTLMSVIFGSKSHSLTSRVTEKARLISLSITWTSFW